MRFKLKQSHVAFCSALLLTFTSLLNTAIAEEQDIYMGAPVTLVEAPNGAITNKEILDRVENTFCMEPEILQPAEGIWTFCGFGLVPISVIDTDEGLIAFDTGDSKHDGEILLKAIRSVSDKLMWFNKPGQPS